MSPDEFAEALDRVHLSRETLARLLGCHRKTIYQMHTGQRRVPPTVARWLTQLAHWYDTHPAPTEWRVR